MEASVACAADASVGVLASQQDIHLDSDFGDLDDHFTFDGRFAEHAGDLESSSMIRMRAPSFGWVVMSLSWIARPQLNPISDIAIRFREHAHSEAE
ncbi:hypothetical protein [Aminobacter aminovorans]|uniref:hypothetical protein n=1 Tax=Aminobacter aminovorans TaxID=83263 RepID=UPI000E202AC0|nr:hypothetical protein [Aminobacter aminovorans]